MMDAQLEVLLSQIPEIDRLRTDWLQKVHLAFTNEVMSALELSLLYLDLALPDKYQASKNFFNQLCTLYIQASSEDRRRIRAAFKTRKGATEQLYNYYWQLFEDENIPLDISKVRLVLVAVSIENIEPTDYWHAPAIIYELCSQAQQANIDVTHVIGEVMAVSGDAVVKILEWLLVQLNES